MIAMTETTLKWKNRRRRPLPRPAPDQAASKAKNRHHRDLAVPKTGGKVALVVEQKEEEAGEEARRSHLLGQDQGEMIVLWLSSKEFGLLLRMPSCL